MLRKMLLAAGATFALATPTLAHVSLETGEAAVGSTYKAVLRVPHGCDGAATNTVRVRIPEGFISVKPMPKAGWTMEKLRGKYARTYDYHGSATSEGVTEVLWRGGSLPDDEYDEFVLRGTIAIDLKPGETIYFPVVQECAGGKTERWIELPATGQSSDDLELPAPGLKLRDKVSGT